MLRNTIETCAIACCALLTWAVAPLHGGVIRGVVVEHQTGKVLSRATVTLHPVPGTAGTARTMRTNNVGQFEFDALVAGSYLVNAARRGFIPAQYGQKQWNSAGVPVTLAADGSAFLNIRLPRYPGITGTVVDENDVGLPDMEVLAYRNTRPPQLAGRAVSDDRGVYRIPGLTPGTYLVRSGATRGEVLEYLPTFSHETLRVDEARQVQVFLDDDARYADVRPIPGRLFTLLGAATSLERSGPITVTLSSDTGRQTVTIPGPGTFRFEGLPPGPYEIDAEAPEDPSSRTRFQSGFTRVNVGGNTTAGVRLSPNQPQIEIDPPLVGTPPQILARRVDLAGVGPETPLKLDNGRAALALGHWQFHVQPPAGYYVSGVRGASSASGAGERVDGWVECDIGPYSTLRFSLTAGGGSVHGVVKASGEPAVGAPVYLEAYDPSYRKRLVDLRTATSDLHGGYRFDNLPPGTYRVLATFEYQNPDPAAMDLAQASTVQVEANGGVQADLTLFEQR